jgi:hypothetical protein
MNEKSWSFTVVGCDSNNIPKYLGVTETREEADKLKKEMEAAGWCRVAVFNAAHQEQIAKLQKEIAAKDKQLEHWERLLKEQQGHGRGSDSPSLGCGGDPQIPTQTQQRRSLCSELLRYVGASVWRYSN